MKQFYSRFQVMLLTFAFGLAVVPFSNGLYEKWSGIPVNLPKVKSDSPIVAVVSTERKPINMSISIIYCNRREFLADGTFEISKGKKAKDNPKKK